MGNLSARVYEKSSAHCTCPLPILNFRQQYKLPITFNSTKGDAQTSDEHHNFLKITFFKKQVAAENRYHCVLSFKMYIRWQALQRQDYSFPTNTYYEHILSVLASKQVLNLSTFHFLWHLSIDHHCLLSVPHQQPSKHFPCFHFIPMSCSPHQRDALKYSTVN